MSIPVFNVQEQWTGDGTISDYTFDFTIQDLEHLLVIVQNSLDVEVQRVRGSDTSYLSGVVFDATNGGGTVSLQAVLPNGYTITMLMANDAPSQPSEFKNKHSFTLELFELALDFITTALQRVAWLSQRSLRINDVFSSTFDPQLPSVMVPDAFLKVKSDGTGFDFGPTAASLTDGINDALTAALAAEVAAAASAITAANSAASAVTSAGTAAVSAVSASASATSAAASAVLAASFASGIIRGGPFAPIAPNTNADLAGEVTDSTKFTMVEYTFRIRRGTTVCAKQVFTIFYRNGAWEYNVEGDSYADAGADHGVTFTANAVTAQINAAVANDGGSNAVIDFFKIQFAV